MIRNVLFSVSTLAALAAAAAPVHAQDEVPARSTTRGLSLGAHGSSAALTLVEDRSTSFGGGTGVAIGYGLSDRLAVHAITTGAFIFPSGADSYLLTHVDVEGRYNLGSRSSAWVPHLALGVSGRTGHFDVPASQGGGTVARTTVGLTTGAGLSHYLSRSLALDWSLRYTFGNFKQTSCPDAEDAVRTCAASTRVNFGVSWYPGAR